MFILEEINNSYYSKRLSKILQIGAKIDVMMKDRNCELRAFLGEEKIVWMKTLKNLKYGIHPLTKDIAINFNQELVDIHNLIPNVSWKGDEIKADSLGSRTFKNKWKYSQIVISSKLNEIIGLTLAYERDVEFPEYTQPSIYLHRAAIKKKYQGKTIGLGMIGFTLENAFVRISSFMKKEVKFPVTVQTNDDIMNQKQIMMYEGFGGTIIGKKYYPNKTDLIFGFSECNFHNSILYNNYKSQRIQR